jgi:hypothetical protein
MRKTLMFIGTAMGVGLGPLRIQTRLLALRRGLLFQARRSVLRHILVTSKQGIKDRVLAAMEHLNQALRTWSSTRGLTNTIKPPDFEL